LTQYRIVTDSRHLGAAYVSFGGNTGIVFAYSGYLDLANTEIVFYVQSSKCLLNADEIKENTN